MIGFMVSIVPGKSVIVEVAEEKEPITKNSLVIKVVMKVFPVIVRILSGNAMGGITVPAVVSLPSI